MTYQPPEDQALEQALVAALRDVVKAGRDLLSAVETEHQLDGWRWRVQAASGEATDMALRLVNEPEE